jgi:hypothetical protein
MPIYMVDRRFANPVKVEEFTAAGKVLMPCLEARDVKWISSHLASDGMHSICVYEALDAEAVREANRTAGVPFERVWQAELLTP